MADGVAPFGQVGRRIVAHFISQELLKVLFAGLSLAAVLAIGTLVMWSTETNVEYAVSWSECAASIDDCHNCVEFHFRLALFDSNDASERSHSRTNLPCTANQASLHETAAMSRESPKNIQKKNHGC